MEKVKGTDGQARKAALARAAKRAKIGQRREEWVASSALPLLLLLLSSGLERELLCRRYAILIASTGLLLLSGADAGSRALQ